MATCSRSSRLARVGHRVRGACALVAIAGAAFWGTPCQAITPIEGGTIHGTATSHTMRALWTQTLDLMRTRCQAAGVPVHLTGAAFEPKLGTEEHEFDLAPVSGPDDLRSVDRQTTYIFLATAPLAPGSIAANPLQALCSGEIKAIQTAHFETLRAGASEQIDVNFDNHTGTRHAARVSPWVTSNGPERLPKALQLGMSAGARATVAGYQCQWVEQSQPAALASSFCLLLEQPGVPSFAVGFTIADTSKAFAMSGEHNAWEVVSLSFNVPIDPHVFDVPTGIRFRGTPP